MFILFYKGIIIFSLLCTGAAFNGMGNDEDKNVIVTEIINKIEKILDILSKASTEEKPRIILLFEEKLKAAATQSFGDDGRKYVDIIMEGIKTRALSDSSHASSEESENGGYTIEPFIDKYDSDEDVLRGHLAKKITDKIESFANKYLNQLKSVGEKRVFLETVRKRMLELAQVKNAATSINGAIVNYNEIITNSINDILKKNLGQNSRRTMSNFRVSAMNHKQNFSKTGLEQNRNNVIDIVNSNFEIVELDTECIETIALTCSEVNNFNKFTCSEKEKPIEVDKFCDGIFDCSDGSDEINCREQAMKKIDFTLNALFEMNRSFEENCFLGKVNESIIHNEIFRDWIKAQIDVIQDFKDNIQDGTNNQSDKVVVKNIADALKTVTINLSKGVCSGQEKSSVLVANSRTLHSVLDENLENVLRDSALFPKSCVCKEDRCVSRSCVKSCEVACLNKYNLGRWSCPGVNGTASINLDSMCDGKLDCIDESDEFQCSTGKGRGKFEANVGFLQIIKLLEMKMASKENAHVRNDLLRLYNSINKLQHLILDPKLKSNEIRQIRNKCFELLSLIYGNYIRSTYNSNDVNTMYKFLKMVHDVLVKILKSSHTGNNKIIGTYSCICKNNKCMKSKCSAECVLACEVEKKLIRYNCKGSQQNRSIPFEAICNSKKDCPDGDDEEKCYAEVCRRHHFYFIRMNIKDVGKKQDGTMLGEMLKSWKLKATSTLLMAEKQGRRNARFYHLLIKDLLKDLVHVYASYEVNKKKGTRSGFGEFLKLSHIITNAKKYCGN